MNRPKVVILGGGFGGLAAARALYKDADVTVVDRHNYQTFLPLLYQVSTAGLRLSFEWPLQSILITETKR
jgi:NADH dehydrogenase